MDKQGIRHLWAEYNVPKHIVQHMKRVADVALFMAEKIFKNSEQIQTVSYAALLHDLVKVCDFKDFDPDNFPHEYDEKDFQMWGELVKKYSDLGHERAAAQILQNMNEAELSTIIRKHRFTALLDANPDERPESVEEKIVYYADKRVKHHEIVSLKERLDDGRRRYFPDGNVPVQDDQVRDVIWHLEKELCDLAHISPEDINETSVPHAHEDF